MEFLENALSYSKNVQIDPKLIAEIALAGLFGLGAVYFAKIWRSYKFFQNKGLKTPPYQFFFGNTPELFQKGYANALAEWTTKYGKTYGYFEGHLPVIVTSDMEVVEEVFYKQFSNFTARKPLPQQLSDDSPTADVFMAARSRWKRLRTISNQTFTPAKLKEILPTMRLCSDRLINLIFENLDKELNMTELLDQTTMDVLWNCTFGIDANLIANPNFIYYVKIKDLINSIANFDIFFKLLSYFYEFKPLVVYPAKISSKIFSLVSSRFGNPFYWLISRAHEIIDERLKNADPSKKKNDYVQLLLEAEAEKINLDFDNKQYDLGTAKLTEKKMTREEILMSLVLFMIAGYETTAATINFCLYILMTHPEELARLQEEVDSLNSYDYESINQLEYLECFIKEVLRMYPVAPLVVNRRCTKTSTIKGIVIPEDQVISVDVVSVHYDPENWPGVDPAIFHPDRFASGAKYNKLAYMPFGGGARMCLGMRFALLEMKLIMCKIVKNFEIKPVSSLPTMPIVKDSMFTVRRPIEPIRIIFKKRG